MRPCTTHHHACDCREHKASVLNKAALDAANELHFLAGLPIITDQTERDRIESLVARIHNASEQLNPISEAA